MKVISGYKKTLIALIMLFCMQSAYTQRLHDPQIRKIKFKGNKEFSKKELSNAISFSASTWMGQKLLGKEPSFYTADAYQMNVDEIIQFYQTEGYMHISLGEPVIKQKRRKVEIKFNISEGVPVVIDSVKYQGENTPINKEVSEIQYSRRNQLSALPGKRFRDVFVWNDRDLLTRFMVEQGYAYAETTPEIMADTVSNSATIKWQLNPGPLCYFGDVSVSGNNRTPESVIRRQIDFEQGEIYSHEKLNKSQQQIFQLGAFRVASLRAQLTRDKNDTIAVILTITEAPLTSTRVGVGYGREDQFRAFVDFQVLNFTGGARRLNLYAKHSALEPYRFEATLTQPAAFSPNSTVSLSPFVKQQNESGFKLFSYGVNLLTVERLTSKLSGSINLYYEAVNLDTTSLASSVEEKIFLNQTYSKSGVSTGLLFDSSQPRFSPSSGWVVALNTKANSIIIGGPYPFLKYQFEIKNYNELSDGLIIASRIKGGAIHTMANNSTIPIEERFFAGGSRSIRGWARQQLGPKDENNIPSGGKTAFEATLEPRIKIAGPFSMVAFMDVGYVWEKSGYIDIKDTRLAAGAGIRFSTPIGPVGLDFARPVFDESSSWQIHFNIGHAF